MAQSPNGQSGNQSSVAPSSDLGANEWLVEEMKEQYDKDPGSVGPEWASYFGNGSTAPPGGRPPPPRRAARPGTAPRPRPRPRRGPPHPRRPGSGQGPREGPQPGREGSGEGPAKAPATGTGQGRHADPEPEGPGRQGPQARGAVPRRRRADLHRAAWRPGPHRRQHGRLAVGPRPPPSVRSVPVKLLWDNRTVINNHLARARGGKVSFTHIIGYALVKALRAMPEMNVGFEVLDGKPNLITPAHINLGLAIDMQKPDGTRQLLVPNIKGAEAMDFAAFWTAYEEMVRKARDGKLTVADFQGTTIIPDQPRRHRHRPLGAAADGRAGRDHRRRRDGVPAGVAGRLRRGDQPQRHQQGDDADLHLRPPRHPGRAVG